MQVFEPYLFGDNFTPKSPAFNASGEANCIPVSYTPTPTQTGNVPDILDFLFCTFLRTSLKGKIERIIQNNSGLMPLYNTPPFFTVASQNAGQTLQKSLTPKFPCVYFKRNSFWTFISTINNTIVRRKFFNNSTRLDFGSRIKDFMGVERYLHLARRFAGFLSIHLI